MLLLHSVAGVLSKHNLQQNVCSQLWAIDSAFHGQDPTCACCMMQQRQPHSPPLAPAGGSREYWEDGSAFQDLQRRADEVAAARKAIEAARQASLRQSGLNSACIAVPV